MRQLTFQEIFWMRLAHMAEMLMNHQPASADPEPIPDPELDMDELRLIEMEENTSEEGVLEDAAMLASIDHVTDQRMFNTLDQSMRRGINTSSPVITVRNSAAIRIPLESETGRRVNFDTHRGFGFTLSLSDERDYFIHFSQVSGNNGNNTRAPNVPAGSSSSQIGFYATQKKATSNAEKINGILEDENIPENYFCPLTMSIMTDPVYLPDDVTKKVFERSAITRWLSEKSATHPSRTGPHPFNPNARFSATDLLPENNLKKEIDTFVEQIVDNNGFSFKK